LNDDVVCQAGLFRGDNCDEEVPENQRLIAELRVKVRKDSNIGKLLADPEALARILSSKEGSPLQNHLKNIRVTKLGEDAVFVSFQITITEDAEAEDKIEPDKASQALASFLADDSSFVVEDQNTTPPATPTPPTTPAPSDAQSKASFLLPTVLATLIVFFAL
jgi:hypothetical protein